jgi:hypothetical protein
MSKKLIAIASAAALALAGLVSAPAFAVGLDVSETTNTKATALTVLVPETNALVGDGSGGTDTLYRFDVTATEDDQKIDFAGSEGVKFIIQKDIDDATDNETDPEISAGRTAYSKTLETEGDEVSVFVFNTSTTAGKLVITSGDNRNTYWVKGVVGAAYNMTVTFPTSVPTTGTGVKLKAVVSDVFGNVITSTNAGGDTVSGFTNDVNGDLSITTVGTDVTSSTTWSYSTTKKVWESAAFLAEVAGSGAVAFRVDLISDAGDKPDLTDYGFKAAKATAFSTLSAVTLEDQVAALEAKLANTVSKAKYNNLVKKYNKITRGKKAKLVK